MLPFLPPFANQNQVQGGNDPPPNLFTSSSSAALPNQFGFNNPQMLMPAMGGFNNQNAFLSTLLTQQHLMQGLQNNLMGALLQQGMMPQLPGQQFNLLSALQNPNFLPLQHGGFLGRPPMGQNLNQMSGFSPNGLLGLQNPIFPPNAQLPVIGSGNSNPDLLGNGSTLVGQSSSCLKGLETQITSRKLQEPNLPGSVQDNKFNNGRQWPQMTHGQTGEKNFSNNSSDNVVSNNFNNEQRNMEPSHMRFRKSQSYYSRYAWKKERRFAKNNQRGQHQRKEGTTSFLASNTPNLRKRPLSAVYSESEIQQWREARKNNFPTRANIEKKLKPESANKEEMDSHAKIRRQQLKEVLAKQAELGVEVAVIPSIYRTKPEYQNSKIVNPDEAPYSKKRGRFGRNKRNGKRLKLKNETAPAHEPVVKKREPSLLRKLLNADIRRNKSQLLQAFRFMVLNSFFKSVPDKPLVFPIITAKDSPRESEKKPLDSDSNFSVDNGNAEEAERKSDSALVGAVESEGDEDTDSDGVSDAVYEEANGEDVISPGDEKSEEGEITD